MAFVVMGYSGGAIAQDDGGVTVRRQSRLAKLISSSDIEQASAAQYQQLKQQAQQQGALAAQNDPQLNRLRAIALRILPFTTKWNSRAQEWPWEINLFKSQQINAFCMPGGKIAFFTGIIDTLHLTDDEIAIVMGHEITHALREHSREQIGKQAATSLGANVLSQLLGLGNVGNAVLGAGANLLSLRFSRDDETEADAIGLELAARGGYNPEAGISLWKKMQQATQGSAPPKWLSDHPANEDRIQRITQHLPEVMPLYERAKAQSH
ncbi:MAG TPA: M48 family metallopeptidase [Burkholderiales bacterium]|nr:M48 family metallopeptidase [Burkholderiales bacterium]